MALAILAAGCSEAPPVRSPRAAVSIFPIYDIARRVAGDELGVDLILPPGRFDHDFEPRPQDFVNLGKACCLILVGGGLDQWGSRLATNADGIETLELLTRLEPLPMPASVGATDPDDHDRPGALDPHFWLDPVRMLDGVNILVELFSRVAPRGAQGFRARGAEIRASLFALDSEINRRTKAFSRRSIVTFHGSWNYFANRYGLVVVAVVEPFPGVEPTPRYVRDVLRAIHDKGVGALFSEPQLSPRPARVISDESGVPLFELDPIGGTAGVESYEALLRHNTDVLEKALR